MSLSPLSPLSFFCVEVSYIVDTALALSLAEPPGPSISRDAIYLDACIVLNALLDEGALDDGFYDYLFMHLDYAFAQGGTHA